MKHGFGHKLSIQDCKNQNGSKFSEVKVVAFIAHYTPCGKFQEGICAEKRRKTADVDNSAINKSLIQKGVQQQQQKVLLVVDLQRSVRSDGVANDDAKLGFLSRALSVSSLAETHRHWSHLLDQMDLPVLKLRA